MDGYHQRHEEVSQIEQIYTPSNDGGVRGSTIVIVRAPRPDLAVGLTNLGVAAREAATEPPPRRWPSGPQRMAPSSRVANSGGH